MKRPDTKSLTLAALFFAMGIVLPFFTGQIPAIGSMLLPMHFPVFLCALICGWQYGVPVAVILPLLRSFVFGVPVLYPMAIAVAAEMATYALVAGILYAHLKRHTVGRLYGCLLAAMVIGRMVRAAVQMGLLHAVGISMTFPALFSAMVVTALPGIVLQLTLIPMTMLLLKRSGTVPLQRPSAP